MCLLSGCGKVQAANPAMLRILKLGLDDLRDKYLSDLVCDEPDKMEQYLQRWSRSMEMMPASLHWRNADGEPVDCACSGALLASAPDKESRRIMLRCIKKTQKNNWFSLINQDLTSLQQQYHKIMDEKNRLEEIVEQRTLALTRHANELERANKELDQFAYITSHDLKAPLRAINNLAQWIEEDIGDSFTEETREQMNLLRGRVHRMEGLIDGILQYSRVDRVHSEATRVDVKSLLEEALDTLSPPAGFTVEIAPDMPILKADHVKLFQVFTNLISNAVKYHDRPDGRIQIGVCEKDGWYEFSVSDDGPGIEPQYHDRIFQIFQTLQARDHTESTGVGLTVVKKIIEEPGGYIYVESDIGKGATFRFTWPKFPARGEKT